MSPRERSKTGTAASHEIRVPVPGHPGLALVSSEPHRYTLAILQQLQACLAQTVQSFEGLSVRQLRALLRRRKTPGTVGSHPWVRERFGPQPDRAEDSFNEQVARSIHELEHAQQGPRPDRRGTLLRLRYLQGSPAKEVRQTLYLSESHYHRLHSDGLRWLAEQLGAAAKGDPERQAMGVRGEFLSSEGSS